MGQLSSHLRPANTLVQLDQFFGHRDLPLRNGVYDSVPKCFQRCAFVLVSITLDTNCPSVDFPL